LNPGTIPVQLTYSSGANVYPSWTGDGSGILYSRQRLDVTDGSYCLSRLPAAGGTEQDVWCGPTFADQESTTVAEVAAASADGRLAFVRSQSGVGAETPDRSGLYLGLYGNPDAASEILPFPANAPGVPVHDALSELRWLDAAHLLYLAEVRRLQAPCQFCELDTLRTGVAVVRVTLTDSTPTLAMIPGTDSASSYALVGTDSVYFTRDGQSAIYRTLLSGGVVDVAYDFGPGRIARGVQAEGGRCWVIVDGQVTFSTDSGSGATFQRDNGGDLHVITLGTGADTVVQPAPPSLSYTTLWFRRPLLSPAGTGIAMEGRPVTLVNHYAGDVLISVDTLIGRTGEIWRYDVH